jgi:MoaA/NifB/PqqE/SkfB family radical SAM enzyme
LGTSTLWFALNGADEIHDHAMLRKGAFRKSLRSIELTSQTELRVGCNLFVTKENVHQFDHLVAELQQVGIQEIIPCLYGFLPLMRVAAVANLSPSATGGWSALAVPPVF